MDSPIYDATWGERLALLLADAREYGMKPLELCLPARYVAYIEDQIGGPYREEEGLPVVPHQSSKVMLVCDRGDVSYTLFGWRAPDA
jgi:hypothetical protein